MASIHLSPPMLVPIALLFGVRANGCCTSIFSFGDSIADAGNYLLSVDGKPCGIANLPCGETFFHSSTGRFCDGRIIVDFIAEALNMPFLPPSLGASHDSGFRVNFAVGGATGLDGDFFREKGMNVTSTNNSLGVQMEWFKQLLPSLCSSPPLSDCSKLLSKTLFLVGENGGNDYNSPFSQEYHNSKLHEELDKIQRFYPDATIIYADYYNATMNMFRSPNPLGFGTAPLVACCGGGSRYNCDLSAICGIGRAKACSDPFRYVSWDRVLFTEVAYKTIANGMLNGSFTIPAMNQICPSSEPRMTRAYRTV